MQRYKLFRDSMIEGTPNGDYCLYSDARAEINKAVEANNNAVLAVVSSEKRVKELEVILWHFLEKCDLRFKVQGSAGIFKDVEAEARSALEAPHEP